MADDCQQLATTGEHAQNAISVSAGLRKGSSVYVSVNSTDDLFVEGSQYAFGQITNGATRPNLETGFDNVPLYSPSSAAHLPEHSALLNHIAPSDGPLGSLVTVGRSYQSCARKQSQDGGVRIGGGPPGHQIEDPGDSFLDLGSWMDTIYTLLPEYNLD